MEAIAIVAALAIVEYVYFSAMVGKARVKSGVKAPAITGDPEFERTFRVQQNTLEQLVFFLPSLWLFGVYVHALIGAALGLVFVIGRIIYFKAYIADPEKRSLGFGLGFMACIVLLLGGLIGAVIAWV